MGSSEYAEDVDPLYETGSSEYAEDVDPLYETCFK
jgi:hypothetical protein